MAASEFEAVRPLLKISEERIEAARMVLVDGATFQAAGDKFGWTRQSTGDVVDTVWKAFEMCRESQRAATKAGTLLPPGWEQVTLIAPTWLIDRFRRELAEVATETIQIDAKQHRSRTEKN
jgi:hypothetical protein